MNVVAKSLSAERVRCDLPIPFGWYAVAYSTDLAVGEVKPIEYVGREMVLFRTESGTPKIVDAYCPHLGAHLGHGGKVVGDTIACPFHGWQFNGEGYCEEVPYAKNMPPKADGKQVLGAYPTVEKNQIIWVWYHPEGVAPLFEVIDVPEVSDEDWGELQFHDWIVNTHIQETAENAADAAHFRYVHNAQNVPIGEVTHDGYQRHAHFEMKTPAIDEDGNIDETGTKWKDSYLDTSNNGPGQTWQRFTGFFETIMMGSITPISQNQLHMRFAFSQHKALSDMQKVMAQAMIDDICMQVQQDMPIWNNKIYKPEPILCDGDGPINQYRKWFGQFYAK